MTRRSHAVLWCVLCLASLAVWPLFAEHGALHRAFERDVDAVQSAFGPRVAAMLLSVAMPADPEGIAVARPDGPFGRGNAGWSRATARSPLVERVDRYLATVQLQWGRTVLRAVAWVAWCALLAPVWIAAIVDGLARRAVKDETLGYQNPAAFTLASHAWIAAVMLPWFAVTAPLGLPWWLWPMWGLVAMVPLNVAIAHLQPVFTR